MSKEPHIPEATPEPVDDETLAGEYALGVLSGEQRIAVEARAGEDAHFAARIEAWNARLAGFALEASPAEPPARIWPTIESALFPGNAGLWNSLRFWRSLGIGASTVAVAGLAALFVLSGPPAPRRDLVASLQATDAGPSYLARIDAVAGKLTIRAVQAGVEATRVPELWLIPADGVPRSLGVISNDLPSEVIVPEALRRDLDGTATLAITLEPQGGAPNGKPTGPVIAAGKPGEI
jgi:anti-sigma-K factor RskA